MNSLQTERTIIESITLADAEFFVTLVNSPDWLRFIGDRGVRNVEDAERFLESGLLLSYRERGFGYYMVRGQDNSPIGICGFLKKPHLENVDFGFAFLPEFCGKGYGSEAARAVFDYGIQTYEFSILDAVTAKDNVRSKRLLMRLGFGLLGPFEVKDKVQEFELYRWCAPETLD